MTDAEAHQPEPEYGLQHFPNVVAKHSFLGRGRRISAALEETGHPAPQLAFFCLFADAEVARLITSDPAEAQPAWKTFERLYKRWSASANRDVPLTNRHAHQVIAALREYLMAIETPERERTPVLTRLHLWVEQNSPPSK